MQAPCSCCGVWESVSVHEGSASIPCSPVDASSQCIRSLPGRSGTSTVSAGTQKNILVPCLPPLTNPTATRTQVSRPAAAVPAATALAAAALAAAALAAAALPLAAAAALPLAAAAAPPSPSPSPWPRYRWLPMKAAVTATAAAAVAAAARCMLPPLWTAPLCTPLALPSTPPARPQHAAASGNQSPVSSPLPAPPSPVLPGTRWEAPHHHPTLIGLGRHKAMATNPFWKRTCAHRNSSLKPT